MMKLAILIPLLLCHFLSSASTVQGSVHYYDFVLKETNVTKLCVSRQVLTVNDSFPGPEIRVHKGDTVYVNVYNQGLYGVTLHWHGVKNPRNSWSDGPEYITQCAINVGSNFTYEVIFSDEEGTLWWHAHSDWTRATVHGAIIILPQEETMFPFPKPDGEKIVVIADWFKDDLEEMVDYDMETTTDLPYTSGYTINGELGYFSNCSSNETIHYWTVDYGKTYLLRVINAGLNDEHFFAIAGHNLTVVGIDGSYLKPFITSYLMISPGNTMDVLITMNQSLEYRYYMATQQYSSENEVLIPAVGTAILQYNGYDDSNSSSSPIYPIDNLPSNHDEDAAVNYTSQLRSLASEDYPISVPMNVTTRMFIVVSMNSLLCPNMDNCSDGTDNAFLSASLNNISWWSNTSSNILQAYYSNISGIYTTDFPDRPAFFFNFTELDEVANYTDTDQGTKVKVLDYNETVEIIFQGTAILNATGNHPMHMHGYAFYVVGSGTGNFDNETDPSSYNLVDPPLVNTFSVPALGWLVIRFIANNPGVWYWHCHIDRHMSRGMNTAFIVKDGGTIETSLRPPPANMPTCSDSNDILMGRSSSSSITVSNNSFYN